MDTGGREGSLEGGGREGTLQGGSREPRRRVGREGREGGRLSVVLPPRTRARSPVTVQVNSHLQVHMVHTPPGTGTHTTFTYMYR